MIPWSSSGQATIPARQQPALLLDYALTRDVEPLALLRGTALTPEVLSAPATMVAPTQYQQLLSNVLRLVDNPDTSFMLGQQLLPGQDGALSHALLQAASLRQGLEILCSGASRLTPLLCPRLSQADGMAVLYWTDSYGAPVLLPALVEMHMTAVVSLCRWLAGEHLPWRFCFNRARPRRAEQHEAHLGSPLRFNCQLDAMLIDVACLDRPWPRGNATAARLALERAQEEGAVAPGLLAALYNYLLEHIGSAPTLDQASSDFGISTATMKRQLQRHGTHFQAELDQVRTHKALYLFQARRADNDSVAQYLGFHDAANFRRSFKRWTGQTPALLRQALNEL